MSGVIVSSDWMENWTGKFSAYPIYCPIPQLQFEFNVHKFAVERIFTVDIDAMFWQVAEGKDIYAINILLKLNSLRLVCCELGIKSVAKSLTSRSSYSIDNLAVTSRLFALT